MNWFEERMQWYQESKEKANPNCPTCHGGGIVDIDDFIVSMCPIYGECPGCINPDQKTASGKPHVGIPWTPKSVT